MNHLIAANINGVIHSLFYHNHLRNFCVKNVLDSLTEFLRAHLNDILGEVPTDLRVSPVFMSLARDFEKCLFSVKNIPRVLARYFVNV